MKNEKNQPTGTPVKNAEAIIKLAMANLINDLNVVRVAQGGSEVSNERMVGMIVSKFFSWDVDSIIQTAKFAFEDSNYREGVELMTKLENE